MHDFLARAEQSPNAMGKKLFRLMAKKKTNLAVAADVTTSKQLLDLAETLGPEICVFKTHIDIINDYTPDLPLRLKEIAEKHHFMIFEDRKFADIGNTVKHQFLDGIYRIASWADIINAHSLPGIGIIEGLREAAPDKGLLLIAQMSSKGNLADPAYCGATVAMAEQNDDFVIGLIAQEKVSAQPHMIHMTPGVSLENKGDTLGQQYNTPHAVLAERNSDVIIVGRAIIGAKNPRSEAQRFRESALQAFDQKSLLI